MSRRENGGIKFSNASGKTIATRTHRRQDGKNACETGENSRDNIGETIAIICNRIVMLNRVVDAVHPENT